MTQEEKAKAYDEALKKARILVGYPTTQPFISDLQDLFPELAESGDERIINRIKKAVEEYWSDEPLDEILAWLEKQAEHANFRNKIQIGDKVTRNEDGVLVNLSQLKRVAKKDEKQGEQKYTQRDIDDAYLKGIADVKREVEKIDEQTEKMKKEIAEFIFNSKEDIKQRYEWIKCLGFDVKFSNEEKQAEQKPTFEMKTPEESLGVDSDTYNKIVDECVYGEQKPAWSEEDEDRLNSCVDAINAVYKWDSMIAWLKSLKDKVQPQPKQEWSEEDEAILENVIKILDGVTKGITADITLKEIHSFIVFLRSLRPQNTWKPSDEQMELLREVQQALLGKDCHNRFVNFMYELKRLRGE